jgi:hypothetical protein
LFQLGVFGVQGKSGRGGLAAFAGARQEIEREQLHFDESLGCADEVSS